MFLFTKTQESFLDSPGKVLNLVSFLLAVSTGAILFIGKDLIIRFLSTLLICLFTLSQILPENSSILVRFSNEPWFLLHIGMAILGDFLFLISFVCSSLYIWLDAKLKAKETLRSLSQFPSLGRLEFYNIISICGGIICMAVAITSGMKGLNNSFLENIFEPRILSTFLISIAYVAILILNRTKILRGRYFATSSLAIFSVLATIFLGLSVLGIGTHAGSAG